MLYITSPEQVQQCDAGALAYQILCEENQQLARWLWERNQRYASPSLIYQLFVWQWPEQLPLQAYFAVYLSLEFLQLVQRTQEHLGN